MVVAPVEGGVMWCDKDTDQDCLGFAANVEVLARCCTDSALSPLTLGIFGLWGSGKTSLMRMIKKQIEDTNDRERVLTLWFNAWRYEGRDEAQSALIHAVLRRVSKDRTFTGDVQALFDRILNGASVMKLAKAITKSLVTMTPDLDGLLSCFSDESKKLAETMEGFEQDFEKLLGQVNVDVIVVFIDDLDRCSSGKVVETFETIKLFLNTPRCTFVIGADPKRIEEAVGEVYGANHKSRRDYLEKIIHVPFQIPEQGLRDIQCYVGLLVLQPHLNVALWKDLLEYRPELHASAGTVLDALKAWLTEHRDQVDDGFEQAVQSLDRVLSQATTIARGLRGNPRQIKRFLNILALREQLATTNRLEIDHAVLTKLAILEYTWHEFFETLVESVDPATGNSEFLKELLEKDVRELDASQDSVLLATAAKEPGLVTFLKSDPSLPTDLNLTPYLFLAQTSFGSSPQTGLATLSQVVTHLVEQIATPDRVRSRAAARRAAQEENAILNDIVRALAIELVAKDDVRIRTNIIIGLDEICRKTPHHYTLAMDALRQLSGDVPEAVGLAASTLLGNAEAHLEVEADLKTQFATGKIVQALMGKPPTTRPGRRS